jgi:hypothetical protein
MQRTSWARDLIIIEINESLIEHRNRGEIFWGRLDWIAKRVLQSQYGSSLHLSNAPLWLSEGEFLARPLRRPCTSHAIFAFVMVESLPSQVWPDTSPFYIFMIEQPWGYLRHQLRNSETNFISKDLDMVLTGLRNTPTNITSRDL